MYRPLWARAFAAAMIAGATACAASVSLRPSVPDALGVAPEQQLALLAHARGVQVYACKAGVGDRYDWALEGPQADLFDRTGNRIGRHYAGPTWEAADGSRVTAQMQAHADAPDGRSIPWLLLSATTHEGAGVFAHVASIQRIDTEGGRPSAQPCDASHAGAQARVPYEATYYFYGTAP